MTPVPVYKIGFFTVLLTVCLLAVAAAFAIAVVAFLLSFCVLYALVSAAANLVLGPDPQPSKPIGERLAALDRPASTP